MAVRTIVLIVRSVSLTIVVMVLRCLTRHGALEPVAPLRWRNKGNTGFENMQWGSCPSAWCKSRAQESCGTRYSACHGGQPSRNSIAEGTPPPRNHRCHVKVGDPMRGSLFHRTSRPPAAGAGGELPRRGHPGHHEGASAVRRSIHRLLPTHHPVRVISLRSLRDARELPVVTVGSWPLSSP